MRYALFIAVGAPAFAAGIALLWHEPLGAMGPELGPRGIGGLGLLASLGASIWIAVMTAREAIEPTAGFMADPWRALLAIGVIAGALAWLVRRREEPDVLVARLGLTAALVGAILAADGATAAIFLASGSACVLWLAVRGHISTRTAATLVISDLVLIGSIWVRSVDGLGTPMRISGFAGLLWIAALLARSSSWARTDEAGLALGYRLQSLWFAYWVAGEDPRTALALAAAAVAVIAARAAARRSSASAVGAATSMLAVVAIAGHDSELSGAVVILAAATAVSGVLEALGRARGVLGGLVPVGAALPGVALLASVVLRDTSAEGRLVALGVIGASAFLVVATGMSLRDPRVRARATWAIIPAAAGVAVATVPRVVADAFAPGTGTLTPVDIPLPQWFVPAAFAAIVVASIGTRDVDHGHVDGPEVVGARWDVRREHLVAGGVMVLSAGAMLMRGIGRGFL